MADVPANSANSEGKGEREKANIGVVFSIGHFMAKIKLIISGSSYKKYK